MTEIGVKNIIGDESSIRAIESQENSNESY